MVSIYRPLTEGASPAREVVRFDVLFGITASTEGGDDLFQFAFFNANDDFLAALVLDTTIDDYGIWTDDGTDIVHTGEDFLTDFVHALSLEIDLTSNTWSGTLDNIPIFDDLPFTTYDGDLDVGGVAAEWELSDADDPGDNWLLFDDWSLVATESVETGRDEFHIADIRIGEAGSRIIVWQGTEGSTYQIEYSADGMEWFRDLPGSAITAEGSVTPLTFSDTSLPSGGSRLYRVVRSDTVP